MASQILLRARTVALPVTGCALVYLQTLKSSRQQRMLHAEAPPRSFTAENSQKHQHSHNNARVIRQMSAGSIAGVCGGLAVSVFSKTLAVLIGLAVVTIQALEQRGIHVIPYRRIQRWVRGVNIQSALRENVPFKLCFGTTFALAAVGSF